MAEQIVPEAGTSVTPTEPLRRRVGRFFTFAAVAFAPLLLGYILMMRVLLSPEPQSFTQLLGAIGVLVLCALAPLAAYHLWRRTPDRLIRWVCLLSIYEVTLLAACLLVGLSEAGTAQISAQFCGAASTPLFPSAAGLLLYGQVILVPSAVVATGLLGRRVPSRRDLAIPRAGAVAVSTMVIAAVLPAAMLVGYSLYGRWQVSEEERRRLVAGATQDIHHALETYAAAHGGLYPPAHISWETRDSAGMAPWFRSYPTFGRDDTDEAIGQLPVNPYTARTYVVGKDFFYFPSRLKTPGDSRKSSTADGSVPFSMMTAPRERPGTIAVLGYTPGGADAARPTEYVVVYYTRDVREPFHYNLWCKEYDFYNGPRSTGIRDGSNHKWRAE